MTENNKPAAVGGVRSTSVSITLNAKSLGVDAFVKLEQTHEFIDLVPVGEAMMQREEIAELLTEEILAIIANTASTVKQHAAENPRGAVSVHPVNPAPAPVGTQAGQQAPAQPAQAIAAVANGADFSNAWMSCPSRFGDGDIRFLSTAAYSSEQMEYEVGQWLSSKGLNPSSFKVWDNRPGPKGLEAGVPNGAVGTVKVGKDVLDQVPNEFEKVPAARIKFNNNGSLYIWFTKEFEAFTKYGGAAVLKAGG
jgi:hypothetical protein